MSSSAFVTIDGYPLFETRNWFNYWYFQPSDASVRTITEKDLNPLLWGELNKTAEPIEFSQYVFSVSASVLKGRLNIDGFNFESMSKEFDECRLEQIKTIETFIDDFDMGTLLEEKLEFLKKSTLNDWLEALKFVIANKLTTTAIDNTQRNHPGLIQKVLEGNFEPNDWSIYEHEFGIPLRSKEFLAVAMLECVDDEAECLLDVTDLVDNGWTDEFDNVLTVKKGETTFYEIFDTTAMETIALMKLAPQNPMLIRILYANIITAMETYLSDTLKKAVVTKEAVKRKYLESHAPFRKERLEFLNIYSEISGLNNKIMDAIDSTSFHDLRRIPGIYKDVLDTHFEKTSLSQLIAAVEIRHDIIHRNGTRKDGVANEITESDVRNLFELVKNCIKHLDKQIIDSLITTDEQHQKRKAFGI